jgi:hypothetical protein
MFVTGATGTSIRFQGVMVNFNPDIPIYMMKWNAATWPGNDSGQTNGYASFYEVPIGMMGNAGGSWANQTESTVFYVMHTSGTFMNMTINVTANARTETIPFSFRKNQVDAMVITVPATTTGILSNIADSVHVIAGDTVTYKIGMNTGADSGRIAASYLSTEFVPDSNAIELAEGFSGGHTNSAGTSTQMTYMAVNSWGGNEYRTPAYVAGTINNQSVYVLTNTLSGSSTFNLTKGGSSINGTITIPTGQTGNFLGTGSDVIAVNDLLDYTQVAAAGTGSITFASFGSVLTTTTTERTPSTSFPTALFPSDNIWNVRVDGLPVSSSNTVWMANAQTGHNLSIAFGNTYANAWNGIPYNLICGGVTPLAPVTWESGAYITQSDTLSVSGLPIPTDAILQGDPGTQNVNTDRHMVLVDTCTAKLYEMWNASRTYSSGAWTGAWTIMSLSTWTLTSDALRTDTWTSADAAGLPILPGLVRWDEVAAGSINHALRFTLALTHGPHIWPARHDADSGAVGYPPFGMRVRLKASVNISGYSAINQIILTALKQYGMFMADNGTAWQLAGAPSSNWNDPDLHNMIALAGSDFEVVNTDSLMIDPNSGQTTATVTGSSSKSFSGRGTFSGRGKFQ